MYSDDSGCYRLCMAVIKQARMDYITGNDRERTAIEHWIRSKAFAVFSLNAAADPDDVIYTWREMRRRYYAERLRVRNRVEREGS